MTVAIVDAGGCLMVLMREDGKVRHHRLLFHNFGKMRFKAYSRLSSWTQAGSFVLMGDLFFSPDMVRLEKAFRILRQIKPRNGFRDYALLVMSKDSGQMSMD